MPESFDADSPDGGEFTLGSTMQLVGELLAESVDLCANQRVLDIMNGVSDCNATHAGVRRFAQLTSVSPSGSLHDFQRTYAGDRSTPFVSAPMESLPFSDAAFDLALSTFGVMFARDPQRAAAELVRVVRRGGRIGLTNWRADGFMSSYLRLLDSYGQPSVRLSPTLTWTHDDRFRDLFGDHAAGIHTRHRDFAFRYRTPVHWIQFFRDFHCPTQAVFAALDPANQKRLECDIARLLEATNTGGSRSLVVPARYAETVITLISN